MAKINSFEEIPVWQQSIELAIMVYKICEKGKLKTDFDFILVKEKCILISKQLKGFISYLRGYTEK